MSAQTVELDRQEAEPIQAEETASSARRRVTPGRLAGLVGLAAMIAAPLPFGDYGLFIGQFALVYAILGLSIVVVTGYAGMLSLMTYSFAGIGAVVTAAAMSSWDFPFWMSVFIAAAATVPVAVFVGMVSVRLKGLYLAIATLTLSTALGETFFKWDAAMGGRAGWLVEKPAVGPIDLASEAAFYVVLLGVVALLVWMIGGLRTSRLGRAMLAVRNNELEAQALGINPYRTKLSAFVYGGMIAGVGGSFLALLLTNVTREAFQSPQVEVTSILLVSLVVIGGMNRAIGAVLGAVALVAQQQVFQGAEALFSVFGLYAAVLLILFLRLHPGGIVQLGQSLAHLTRVRPALGIGITSAILLFNIGGGYLIVRYLS